MALVAAAVVVAAAAAGGTVALTRSPKKLATVPATKTKPVPNGAVSPAGYASFESEYPATKGAIAKISSIGCDGSAYVGTGFAIDAHHIVTAGHVVEGSKSMTVTVGGNPVPTQIIGVDASGDVALLQSDSSLPAPYIPLGDSPPSVGERVAAIGFPLGGDLTITQGSVSALGQSITVNSNQLAGLVQTDTAINPGNSGGPLVALDGSARGIVDALNTQANATGYAIAPQYARSEVQHWIASPESHPLPLCSAPDPYGSVQVSTPTPSGPTSGESAAASQLASVLGLSASARGTVVAATGAVGNCSADPLAEANQVQNAIAQRESGLQQLNSVSAGALPDGSAMISDLVSALQASDQADQDYMRWMSDVESTTCPYPTTSDSNFQAASGASAQATSAKAAFLALWNPIAAQLNLGQYNQGQI